MMKNNKKIARELIKIAKELCAASFPLKEEKIEELIQRAINNNNYDEFVNALKDYKNQFLALVARYKKEHIGDFYANQASLEGVKKLLKQTREKLLHIREMEENLEKKKKIFERLKDKIKATIDQKRGQSLIRKLNNIYKEEKRKLEEEKELHEDDFKIY